jgi:hypothetical protein
MENTLAAAQASISFLHSPHTPITSALQASTIYLLRAEFGNAIHDHAAQEERVGPWFYAFNHVAEVLQVPV